MTGTVARIPFDMWRATTIAGVIVGVAYVLSPLTVVFAVAAVVIVHWAGRGLLPNDRRAVQVLVVTAIVLRVVAVAGLFITRGRANAPFAVFFGDEELFIRRSIWLRNLAVGTPIHGADLIYAFDVVGETSYLYILAFIQILVGPSPYGVHLTGVAFYLTSAVLLYRLVRPTLGRMPALAGLALLLYLPSLFAWSISALKEPFFFLLTALTILLVVTMCRSPRWVNRAAALMAVVALIVVIETARRAGGALAAVSLTSGVAIAWLVARPRLLTTAIVLAPIALGVALSRPEAQVKVYQVVQQAAVLHAGHIMTAGYVYKTLDDRFYANQKDIGDMRLSEAARFLVRSVVKYVTVPLPWDVQSRAALLYVPEQVIWYVLVMLLPVGIVSSFRRDALVTALLMAYAAAAAFLIAITSGNVGTLVRHRGMAMPYIVWLSAVGGCDLVTRLVRRPEVDVARADTEPRWIPDVPS